MVVADRFEAVFGLPLAAEVETEVSTMPSESDQMIVFKFILGVGARLHLQLSYTDNRLTSDARPDVRW